MATANCPSCGLGLQGLPESRRVLVTCPSGKGGCGSKFYYPAVEHSAIGMRCAQNGRHFTAVFKRTTGPKFTIERLTPAAKGVADVASGTAAYNADAYDFGGFYCPCCGYAPDAAGGAIVKCGTCHEFVCQGLTYDKLDGPTSSVRWHVCYPECGAQGAIVGTIQEFEATRSATLERAPVARLSGSPPPLKIGKG